VKPNTPIEHAYFVEQGIISVMATTSTDCQIQVGLIGREGMVGTPIILGTDRTPHESVVQMPSTALRIRADDLRDAIAASRSLHQHLSHFATLSQSRQSKRHYRMAATALTSGSRVGC
jgi:CRP-like cAMP-binding protein